MQNIINSMTRIGPLRLAAVGAMGLGLIIFFVFVSSRLSSGQMKLLYADLSSNDRNAVVRELEAAEVTYSINDITGEVLVGAKEVGRVRMLLAEKGLPEGGSVGYEIFDKERGLGTTSFDQNMLQLRALEGELVRTINTIKSVDSSRIHLVLPKRELFSRESRPATASVFLKLRSGQRMDSEQVQAIQHLIAAAVPELNPKNVSIVDQAGNLLANGRDEQGTNATSMKIDNLRTAFEDKLRFQIEEMLTRIVGPQKARVVVSADINYDRVTTSAEEYDPESQVARSTQTVEENENESEAQPNNVTVQNNLPGLPGENQGGGDTRASNRLEEITNFEISKTIRNHVREGGEVNSLSVAVLIDGIYSKNDTGDLEYQERTEEELNKIKALVSSAVNFNQERGDTIEVVNMRFVDGEDMFSANQSDAVLLGLNKDDLLRIGETGVLGLVAILIILLVLRPMTSKLLSPREGGMGNEYLTNPDGTVMLDAEGKPMLTAGAHVSTLMIEKDSMGSEDGMSGEDDDMMVNIAAVDGKIKASSIQKVHEIIDRYPNEAVSILRSWMFQEV